MPAVPARLVVFAYLAGLVPAALLALAQPVWSLVDEAQHYDFVVQLAQGAYPTEGAARLRPETREALSGPWPPYRAQPRRFPAVQADPAGPPAGVSDYARRLWMSRHVWEFSYEAQQPPLYYLAAIPAWKLADLGGGPRVALFALRLLNALLLAGLAPVAMLMAWALRPERTLAVAAVIVTATLPGLVLNATQVTNEAAAVLLGGISLLLALRWAVSGWNRRRALLLGLVFGAALLTSITAAGLAPALALALFWPGAPWSSRFRWAATAGAAAAACLLPWFALNLAVYHQLTPAQAANSLAYIPGGTPGPAYLASALLNAYLTFWVGEPGSVLPGAGPFLLLVTVLAGLSLAGVERFRGWAAAGAWRVLALAVAGQALAALAVPALWGSLFLAPGRYLYPAAAAATVLFAAGLWRELGPRLRAPALAAGSLAALGCLLAFAAGLPASGRTPLPQAGQSISQDAAFAGFEVTLDGVSSSGGAWVHVEARNGSGTVAEWSPEPIVLVDGRQSGLAGYEDSSDLPVTLAPGAAESGWIKLPVDAATLASGRVSLRFWGIALDHYRQVGAVEVPVRI